ncbi:MAG: PKD domain-containing protein [Bacteroidales bacterium]|nr:PKD domain-containing protein [Bacteroidales bacterium]
MLFKNIIKFAIYFFLILIALSFPNHLRSQTTDPCDTIIHDKDFTFIRADDCSGTSVHFTPGLIGGKDYSYHWDFGDGRSSNSVTPTHEFQSFGCATHDFNVKLTISAKGCIKDTSKVITIRQVTELKFSEVNSFNNCEGQPNEENKEFTIRITNNTNETCITSYINLDWGDNTSTTVISPQMEHTYFELGEFPLRVEAENDNGCISVFDQNVVNQSNPTVGIICKKNTEGVIPLTVPFELEGFEENSAGTTYHWTFGDGESEDWDYDDPFENSTIYHTYYISACGRPDCLFEAEVTATNGCASRRASCDAAMVMECPSINDIETEGSLCTNNNIRFSGDINEGCNYNCSPVFNHEWDFGDGTTSQDLYPVHQYTSPGNYRVTLIVYNSLSKCSEEPDVFEKQLTIASPAVAMIATDQTEGCIPMTVNFTNSSTGSDLTYQWSVTPGNNVLISDTFSANQTIVFNQTGSYVVSMLAKNSCNSDKENINIDVYDFPEIYLKDIDNYCSEGEAYQILPVVTDSSESGIKEYSWTFTGGMPSASTQQNPGTITYDDFGTYDVSVAVTNLCGTVSDTASFIFGESVNVNAGDNAEVCSDTISLLAQPEGGIWKSNRPAVFEDSLAATTGVMVESSGYYHFTYTYNDLICGASIDTVMVYFNLNPVADIENSEVCGKKSLWPFVIRNRDGALYCPDPWVSITSDSLIAAYSGEYSFIWENQGCSEIRDTFKVKFKPIPNAATEDDKTVCYTNSDKIVGLSAETDLGHGTWTGDENNQSGVILWNSDSTYCEAEIDAFGGYKFIWKADHEGCTDSDTLAVGFYKQPDADLIHEEISDTSLCGYDILLPLYTAENIKGSWFCDSPHATFSDYSNDLIYTRVRQANHYRYSYLLNNMGCRDTSGVIIQFLETPALDGIIDTIICNTLTTDFPVVPNKFDENWILPDDVNLVQVDTVTVNTVVPGYGSYHLVRVAQNEICFDTADFYLRFFETPVARFELSKHCGIDTVRIRIKPESKIAQGCYCFWKFNIHNDTVCDPIIPYEIEYSPPSAHIDTTYYIELRIDNFCGRSEMTDSVVVLAKPGIKIDQVICSNEHNNLFILDSTFYPDRYHTTSEWIFGDGYVSDQLWTEHSYQNNGLYDTVFLTKLITTNKCGTDTLSWNVTVIPDTVFASFTVDPDTICLGDTIWLTNHSNMNTCEWYFGYDEKIIFSGDSSFVYEKDGSFTIEQYAKNSVCEIADTAYHGILVKPIPFTHFEINDTVCKYDTVLFTNYSETGNKLYYWDFGNSGQSTHYNPYTIYTADGYYNVRLKVTDTITGCSGYDSLMLFAYLPITDIELLNRQGCSPLVPQIANNSTGGNKHYWDFGDGHTSHESVPFHVFYNYGSLPAEFHITYEITGNGGCSQNTSDSVIVYPNPTADFTYKLDTTYDYGSVVQLRLFDRSELANEYKWYNIYGLFSTDQEPVLSYESCLDDTIRQVVITEYNCTDTLTEPVKINISGLFFPNAFAPEAFDVDAKARYFMPIGTCIDEIYLKVFDFNGNLIWSSTSVENGIPTGYWDGVNQRTGKLYPPGVYNYSAEYKFIHSPLIHKKQGTVVMIY